MTSVPHVLHIPAWHPVRLNELVGVHWGTASRRKKKDREIVGWYAIREKAPKAKGKRTVSMTIILQPGQRAGDPDCYWKSTLDALVSCGLLVDDNRQHVECLPVQFERGPTMGTLITLYDVQPSISPPSKSLTEV